MLAILFTLILSICFTSNIYAFKTVNRISSLLFHRSNSIINNLPNAEIFYEAQWELMKKYQLGNFIGIQTAYDPDNDDVAEFMYTQSNLVLDDNTNIITHTNSIVAQEIRSDCETCFDSEKLKSKVIGQYSKGKLRSRLCESCEVRGPGLTPRGLSTEFIIRHEDSKIRVLLAYEPYYYDTNPNSYEDSKPAFKFSDYIIVRERISRRPLNLDDDPDNLWLDLPNNNWFENNYFSGFRHNFINGLPVVDAVEKVKLPVFTTIVKDTKDSNNNSKDHIIDASVLTQTQTQEQIDETIANELNFKRILNGGILIQTPMIIDGDNEAIIRISFVPLQKPLPSPSPPSVVLNSTSTTTTLTGETEDEKSGADGKSGIADKTGFVPEDGILYAAQIGFVLPISNSGPGLAPPRVNSFFVEKLRKVVE